MARIPIRKRRSVVPITLTCTVVLVALPIFVNFAHSQDVTQRHNTGKSVASGAEMLMKAVNKSSVNYLIRKHARKKHEIIANTLRNNPRDGLLLEAIVYRQKYGSARMFWSVTVIGSGDTPTNVLTEYSKKPRIRGAPGKGWELDISGTTYFWYKLDKNGRLLKRRISPTESLIKSVRALLYPESKVQELMIKNREEEVEEEMKRQYEKRRERVRENYREMEYWLTTYGYRSRDDWAYRQLRESLRNAALIRHMIQSQRVRHEQMLRGEFMSMPTPRTQPKLDVPQSFELFFSPPKPKAPGRSEEGVPVHVD